jgi:tetratricopeptide (TPR) repeat protein
MCPRGPIAFIGLLFLTAASLLAGTAFERGEALFENGLFPEAETAYLDALQKNPKELRISTRLGMIALFSNRLDDSEKYLRRAAGPGPLQAVANNLLGEVFYRRDAFPEAARRFRAGGSSYRAESLELFRDAAPYTISGPGDETRLKFVATDPLPIVRVRVDDREAADFLIDTGGAEVQLDVDFAKRLNLTTVGATSATLLDGNQTEMRYSRIGSLTLGEFNVKNIPVGIRSLPVFAGRKLDGVLGTVLFYHFLATFDYPNGELILRRRPVQALQAFEKRAESEKQIVMSFWMASDHVMVARGRVNDAPPALLFVATGLASGFACPESTAEQAALSFNRQNSIVPVAARGVNMAPFVVNDLYLGDAHQQNVSALAGAFPPVLEYAYGFRIAGLISHQFFRPYAVTFDFIGMRIFLSVSSPRPINKKPIDLESASIPH